MKKIISIINILLISLCAFMLTACSEDFTKFSLHFSNQSIEVALGEEKEYEVVIDNFFKTGINFNFDLDKQIISIDSSIKSYTEGRYRIKVKGLVSGNATLTITLLQGKKTVSIPVNVYEPITSFTAKDNINLYVLKGQQITFNSDMFNFYPETTMQRDLTYSINGTELENDTYVADGDNLTSVTITATSVFNTNLFCNFNVKILDTISLENTYLSYNDQQIPSINEDENSYIELIANDENNYKKTLSLTYNNNQTLKYQIFSKNLNNYIETSKQAQFENVLFADIQATDFTGTGDKLVVRVSYADFDYYYEELEYNIKIVSIPRQIKINGQKEVEQVDLFDNQLDSNKKDVLLSVEPLDAEYDTVKVEFVIEKTNPNTLEKEYQTVQYSSIKEYLCVKYKDVEIYDDQVFDDISGKIQYYGKKVLPETVGEVIYIKFICESTLLEASISNQIPVKIHKSATNFYVNNEKYQASTIYVKNGDEVIFEDFIVVEEDAYIGKITARADSSLSLGVCDVAQTQLNAAALKIKALSVGEANYTLILSSGISTKIKIIVKDQLDLSNFWLYVSSANVDNVAEVQHKNINNNDSVSSVALRGVGEFEVSPNLQPRNIDSNMYTLTYDCQNTEAVQINGTKIKVLQEDIKETITVTLTTKKIENFVIIDGEEIQEDYSFEIICFKPITTFSFAGLNASDLNGSYSKAVDVYDKNTPLGYVDFPKSEIDFKLQIDDDEVDILEIAENLEWDFSLSAHFDNDLGAYELTESGGITYGYFYPNDLKFECIAQGSPSGSFTITAKLYEYGKVISSTVTVTIQKYIPVEEIWFYNYTDSIYLDSITNEITLYPYILPSDATNKNILVWFEPNGDTSSSIVQIEYSTTTIKIKYSGFGGGSGNIIIVPTSKFNSNDLSDYSYSKIIPINIGDGTINNPLHIGSFEQFKNIDLTKHYVLDSIIDAGGETITAFGELTGGIKGYNKTQNGVENIGGIINFKVVNPKTLLNDDGIINSYGLFTRIASSGYLINLTIEGSIEIDEIERISYIGLIAGENNGIVKNVNVTLSNSEIISNGQHKTYIGGVVGINNGLIINDIDTREVGGLISAADKETEINIDGDAIDKDQIESTLSGVIKENYQSYTPKSTLMIYMLEDSLFKLLLQNNTSVYYFGGVAGYNKGLIKFRHNSENINKYNYYGTSCYVNMEATLEATSNNGESHIGGIVGYNNKGNIVNTLASGRINARFENNVGGIVGTSEKGKILSNTSRMFVRGNNKVAGLVGNDTNSIVKNNKVQAIDDRQTTGLKASLVVGVTNINSIINSSSSTDASNTAVTYYQREFKNKKESNENESTTIEQYYGDVVMVVNGTEYNGTQFSKGDTGSQKLEDIYNSAKYPNNSIILMYYKAKDVRNQKLLKELNSQFLPQDLFTENVEITITSKATSIISVSSFGKLTLNSTGVVVLTLTSTLNKDNKIDITVYVTNYVSDLGLYTTPDKENSQITNNNLIKISNRNSYNIYPKYISQIYLGNVLIELVENQDLQLEITGNDYATVSQSGKTVIIKGNGTNNSTENQNIDFYVYFNINGEKRYLDKNSYVTAKTLYKQLTMSYTQGIYKIEVDKSNITVIPDDIIKVRVKYYTDDELDVLNLSMHYLNTNQYIDYSTNQTNFEDFFIVSQSESVKVKDGEFYIDYVFEMNTSELIRIGEYEFIFSGADGMTSKVLKINYLAQPINKVIIKNYSFTDNDNIYISAEDENGVYYIYNTSYTLTESKIATAGEPNILKISVLPEFADYSYIEVTNAQSNIDSQKIVLFGLLKPYIYGGVQQDNQAVISTSAYYTSNGIRIYKSNLSAGELNILYRLGTNVLEGETITLNINFYNQNGEVVYAQQQEILTIAINKTVSISLQGKEISDSYYVARGYSYVLDVSVVGYNVDDIVIETSSSYANIVKDGSVFYLKIADNVNYTKGQEGYTFTLTCYGKHIVNGELVAGLKSSPITFTIVEYVVEDFKDLAGMFEDTNIIINNGNTYDVRNLILDKIKVEYSSNAINAVNELKKSLTSKAQYFYKVGDTYSKFPLQPSAGNNEVDLTVFKGNGYNITPKKIGENLFTLGMFAQLQYLEGYIKVLEQDKEETLNDEQIKAFNIIVNQNTSNEHPLPIYTIEDLQKMSDDNHYILMNDIVIPSGFTPLNTQIKKLDGNGKNIIFSGVYSQYINLEKYGVFETIGENTVIQNLTIMIQGNETTMLTFKNEALTSAFKLGLLCAENYGVITNCSVKMKNDNASLLITNTAPQASTNISYIAGLVAVNYGYITNSNVSLKIDSIGANLSGFVGENNGHIASSYVKKSLIKNSSSNVNNSTGGFVSVNKGKVLTSYIEGAYGDGLTPIYANSTLYAITATSIAGAFAYTNDGSITDCYANIPVTSSSENSGFVCNNNGKINNCYTTSKLGNKDVSNYPFVIRYKSKQDITNCYYLKEDTNYNVSINQSNASFGEGLRPTSLIEFAIGYEVSDDNKITNKKLFSEFVFNGNNDANKGVWFYATDNNSFINTPRFIELLGSNNSLTSAEIRQNFQIARKISVSGFEYKGEILSFVSNRPQLVTANLVAYSSKEIVDQEYIEESGETIYNYGSNSPYAVDGSINNPYVIYTANDFEQNVIANSYNNINSYHYRFVKDINYTDEGIVVSSLYKYIMAGYIEGNGITISNFSINSNENLLSGGYFAQIGNGLNYATIQNITFAPKYINLPNALNVGAVAGTLNRGYVYNVDVNGYSQGQKGLVILGRNIVGGVFGRTVSAFDINNITSSVSTNAYLTNLEPDWTEESVQNQILYTESGGNNSTVSYSGSIIGYVGGIGTVTNAKITNHVATIGMICGFMFGGVGINATIKNINLTTQYGNNSFIRASAYAGLIVGELKGTIIDSNVYSIGKEDSTLSLFKIEPKVPLAVGGIAGLVRGANLTTQQGNIVNCKVYEDVVFSSQCTKLPSSVGGLVGKANQNIKIVDSFYYGENIDGKKAVGGLIGELQIDNSKQTVNVSILNSQVGTVEKNTTIRVIKPAQDEETAFMYIGGAIGYISGKVSSKTENSEEVLYNGININMSGVDVNVTISSNVEIYGTLLTGNKKSITYNIYAGGLVGGYMVEELYSKNFSWLHNIRIDLSSTNILPIFDLNARNLRNGNNSFGPYEYKVTISWAMPSRTYYSDLDNKQSADFATIIGDVQNYGTYDKNITINKIVFKFKDDFASLRDASTVISAGESDGKIV